MNFTQKLFDTQEKYFKISEIKVLSSLLDPRVLVQALSFSCIISVVMISRDVSPEDGGVNDVWSVGGSDDEDILLAAHAIHLGQDLANIDFKMVQCYH